MFEQDRFIVRLQQRVAREGDILVCFLSGSFGRRTEDDFADLNVALVYGSDAIRDAAWKRRTSFVRDVMPYVPAKSFDPGREFTHLHSALYSNGAKVDYRFESQTSLVPNPHDREIRILKDNLNWGLEYQQRCAQTFAPPTRISPEELEHLDARFWVVFWNVYRRLLRGETDRPFPEYLSLMEEMIPPLLRILPPEDPAHQALIAAYYSHDARVTREQMRRLLQAYLGARSAVIRRTNVAFMPDGGFERAIQRLLEKHP